MANPYKAGTGAYKFYETLSPAGRAELLKNPYAVQNLSTGLSYGFVSLQDALSDPAAFIYATPTGLDRSPYSYEAYELRHPRGGTFKDFLRDAIGITMMAYPGFSQLVGSTVTGAVGVTAAGAGVSAATMTAINTAVGNVIVNTALNGGDVEKAVRSAAAAYLGSKAGELAGQQAAQFTSNADSIKFLSNVGSAVTRATLLGEDVDKAVLGVAAQAATDFATKNIPGFSNLPAATRNAISSSINASIQGKDVNLSNVFATAAKSGLLEYGLSQVDDYAKLRPEQQQIVRNGVARVLDGGNLSQEVIQGAISFGRDAVDYEIKNDRAKEAGWADYATQQAAKSLYGDKVTPDLYADKQETTEAEAKQIARDVLGREPTEFEWSQLVGLAEGDAYSSPDLAEIKYNESTFDSGELAQAYKDVYGKEPTDEWLAENVDLLGRPDAQAKNMLQNLYTEDKNTTSNTEAEAIWKAQGNTGPIPEDVLFNMLSTSEDASRAMAETYRITAEDRAATTFDGSGYETTEKARAAALGAGYNAFIDPVTGQTRIILPEDESYKRSQLVQQVLSAQGLTPKTASDEQRQQAMSLVSSVPQSKLDSTNVVDLMADAGIAGGSYVKQESNLKYYLTAPPGPSAPKAFDGTKYDSQTNAAVAAASRGKDTFTWTDGKTYKVPTEIATDAKSGALRDRSFANDLVSLADAYERGEISNKEYKFLEAGVKKQTDAVNKLIANKDLKSAQEAAGQNVGWANLGVEDRKTISMLDRAADRVLSLGEGAGNFVAHIGQTIAGLTVDTNNQLKLDPETDVWISSPTGAPKFWMDPNNNIVTNTGNNISEFFTLRYSDQAKNERQKIINEIKRPGATEASVAATVLNNLHGYSTFTGAELSEEIIPFLAGGGIASVLKLGAAGLTAVTGTAATLGDLSEVYGPTYAKIRKESLARGDDEATANALATRAASGNALVTLVTEGPLNFMLAKGLLVDAAKNTAYKVGGNIAAQMAGEYVEAMGHNANELYTTTGRVANADDINRWRGQSTFEALVAGGTTSGMYVLAAANPNKIIGKDYSGNDFTVADAITKPEQFDTKTFKSDLMVLDPVTGKNTSFLDVLDNATTTYANGYSTEITESVISKNPAESLQIMKDMGLANWGANGNITFSQDAGDIATAFISGGFALPQADGTYAPVFGGLLVETDDGYVAPELIDQDTTPTTPPVTPPDVTDVVDKTPTLPDQSSSMRMAFETELAKVIDLGYRNEAAITEALARTADNLNILPMMVAGTIGKTQDQLFVDYLDQVNVAPIETEAPVTPPTTPPVTPPTTPPTTPPATGGEVVAVDPDDGTALVVDNDGNVNVVDNTDGALAPGDTVPTPPTAPVTPPAQTQPDTGGETQTGGVDLAEPTDNVVDPTLDDLLSGIGEEGAATPNLPVVIPPTTPTTPTTPVAPTVPTTPAVPVVPTTPTTPTVPTAPVVPTQPVTPTTPVAPTTTDVTGQLTDIETRLTDAIASAEAVGLSRDQAITAAVDAVAADLGTTRTALLNQLGKTEAALRSEFSTGLATLGAQTTAQYNALTAAQKATADALVAQGQSMQQAIAAAQQQTTGQIADVETRLTDAIAAAEAMGLSRDQAITAAIESVAAELGTTKASLFTKLGTTEASLRTEFATGLTGVSAEVKAAYNSLTAEQKALANQLTQQGANLATAIQTVQQQTQGQIGALSAEMQAKYNALTAEQKALANDIAQQGVDLTTAINLAQQQTQAQITGLGQQVDARINQLMQQGQTYQAATQQAINEITQQNAQMAQQIGTQGRTATQADIDAIQQMLSGKTAVNTAYDVTGDKQVTQADIDFLTGVVGGTNTDWKPPSGSVFAPTGLYGQLANIEAQRQADLAAQREREAEAERQRQQQQKVTSAQQGVQSLMSMVPQMYKAAEETTTPLYSTMDYYDPFGDPFGQTNMRVVSTTVPTNQTKMAEGGYLGDLLAENMSVDDLLNLLR